MMNSLPFPIYEKWEAFLYVAALGANTASRRGSWRLVVSLALLPRCLGWGRLQLHGDSIRAHGRWCGATRLRINAKFKERSADARLANCVNVCNAFAQPCFCEGKDAGPGQFLLDSGRDGGVMSRYVPRFHRAYGLISASPFCFAVAKGRMLYVGHDWGRVTSLYACAC